jgi:hypothetical protein
VRRAHAGVEAVARTSRGAPPSQCGPLP